jgi:hypothetical protein
MMPLTAATHLWAIADTHRVDVGWRENDRVPIWKQFKLEFVEGNKILEFVLCAAAKFWS